MKVKVQIVIEYDELEEPLTEEVACLCRGDLLPETLGLTLEEGKDLLANLQAKMVKHQAVEYVAQQRSCPLCGEPRGNTDQQEIVWRSLFGKLRILSPQLYTCSCQPQKKKSFGIVGILPGGRIQRVDRHLIPILLEIHICEDQLRGGQFWILTDRILEIFKCPRHILSLKLFDALKNFRIFFCPILRSDGNFGRGVLCAVCWLRPAIVSKATQNEKQSNSQ